MPTTIQNMNKTNTPTLSPTMTGLIQQIMDREMDANLVFAQFGKTINVPRNAGTRTVTLRRWVEMPASVDKLIEGVIPDPKSLSQEDTTVTIDPYGEFVRVSDELDSTALDKPMTDAVELMSRMAARSVDTIVKNVLSKGTNVLYANSKTARSALTKDTDVLTAKDIQKAVRLLERTNTRKVNGGYIGILGPDTKYMLMNDENWIDIAKYQEAGKIYNNEVGKLYGVRFVETSEAPIIDAEGLTETLDTLTVASYTAGTKTVTIDEALSSAEAAALAGRIVIIDGEPSEIVSATAGNAGAAALVLKDARTEAPADNDVIYPGEGGAGGSSVAQTFIFGADAYVTTQLQGGGQAQIIVKPLGSAGAEDPLNQYGTVGYKIEGYGSKILHQNHMVVIESALLD